MFRTKLSPKTFTASTSNTKIYDLFHGFKSAIKIAFAEYKTKKPNEIQKEEIEIVQEIIENENTKKTYSAVVVSRM